MSSEKSTLSGVRVGPYVLREELGRGGMGVVYRGERVDGKVSQQVAIKFVRRELLTEATHQRFLLERQTLAAMQHPNIARLLDAAELDDGSPYYVMEYVDGVPITQYCAQASLGIRDRVALFRVVCSAVIQAHQNLVVHRDLKPANILVTASGAPKLLDFGIAKPLIAGSSMAETQTAMGQSFFSPLYAAPEQLTGGTIGVGCDVYALGLLLFELLTGARPFDFSDLSAGQIERLITTVPPAAPSSVAARLGSPKPLQKLLRGDLDDIVLRCLRKAPSERYASVEQLESELRRYLEGLPVEARGGHRWYRAQKFVRRNLIPVGAAALTSLALVAGVLAFAWAARIAGQRAAELEQVANFQAEVLLQVDPTEAGKLLSKDVQARFEAALTAAMLPEAARNEQLRAFASHWRQINATDVARELIDRTILKPAIEAIDKQFKEQPLVDATLRQVLSARYQALGLFEASLPLQQQALDIRHRLLGDDHPDTLISLGYMAYALWQLDRTEEAEALFRDVLERSRRVLGDDHIDTLATINNLASLLAGQGKLEEADPYYRETLDRRRMVFGDEHPSTLVAINNMGIQLQRRGQYAQAEPYHREALEKRRKVLGEEHPDTLTSLNNVGVVLQAMGRLSEAEPYFRDTLEKRRRLLGEEHLLTLASITNLGLLLRSQGRIDEAEPFLRKAAEIYRRVLGSDHLTTILAVRNVGALLLDKNDLEGAEPLIREALDQYRSVYGPEHTDTINSASLLGIVLQAEGRLDEAEPPYLAALEGRRRLYGDDNPQTLRSIAYVASLRVDQGRFREAVEQLAPLETKFRTAFTSTIKEPIRISFFLMHLGRARVGLGEFQAAERNLIEAYEIMTETAGVLPKVQRERTVAIVDLYTKWNQANPSPDLDAKVSEWRGKLAEVDAVESLQ